MKTVTAFEDLNGKLHRSREEAAQANISDYVMGYADDRMTQEHPDSRSHVMTFVRAIAKDLACDAQLRRLYALAVRAQNDDAVESDRAAAEALTPPAPTQEAEVVQAVEQAPAPPAPPTPPFAQALPQDVGELLPGEDHEAQ